MEIYLCNSLSSFKIDIFILELIQVDVYKKGSKRVIYCGLGIVKKGL